MDALWTMIEQRLGTSAKLIWKFHKGRYFFITFTRIHICMYVQYITIYIHLEVEFRPPTLRVLFRNGNLYLRG